MLGLVGVVVDCECACECVADVGVLTEQSVKYEEPEEEEEEVDTVRDPGRRAGGSGNRLEISLAPRSALLSLWLLFFVFEPRDRSSPHDASGSE